MRTRHKQDAGKMLFHWQQAEDEAEWQLGQQQAIADTVYVVSGRRQWIRRWCIVLGLLLLGMVGGVGWYQAQLGEAKIGADLQSAIDAEPWLPIRQKPSHFNSLGSRQPQSLSENEQLHRLAEAGELTTKMEVVDLGQEWAVVALLIHSLTDGQTYRQTRVYRYSDHGWVRAESTAEHWGQARQFESNHFVFHYHAVDEEAVTQAAARLDALYPSLYKTVFANASTGEKVAIVIDPEWTIGGLLPQTIQPDAVTVPSPAATLRPADLAVGDVLLQSAMLALFAHLTEQATVRYNSSSDSLLIYGGLRLWLIWEHDLPLARWREPLVKWVFRDPQVAVRAAPVAIPTFAHDLCTDHSLWMNSPLEIAVPIWCRRTSEGEEKVIAWRYYGLPVESPLTSLMHRPGPSDNIRLWSLWRDTSLPDSAVASVGLATVFEYIASAYGVERIPLLLEALSHHQQVETLIPALFGKSHEDFHRGWQAFVAERYGITP